MHVLQNSCTTKSSVSVTVIHCDVEWFILVCMVQKSDVQVAGNPLVRNCENVLHVSVCVCVCVRARACVCIRTYVHACVRACVCASARACMR